MKYFAVALALVALVAGEEKWKPIRQMEPYQAIHTDCAKESGITPEQAAKIAVFEYPDEEQVHKYVLCGGMKMGVFSDQGFSLDRLTRSFNIAAAESEKVHEVLDKCMENNVEKSTPAVWAYRGFQCMLNSEVGVALKKAIQANREINARKAAREAAAAAAAATATPKLE